MRVLPRATFIPHAPGVGNVNNSYGARVRGTCLPSKTIAAPLCMTAEKPKPGLFGKMRDALLRPIVTVPGSGAKGDLVDCPFCETSGKNDCSGCRGTGNDPMGKCLMCDGKKKLTCTVCDGVGLVDRIRRGGTDGKGQYLGKR